MKIDTTTLKNMALVGAKRRLVELDEEHDRVEKLITALSNGDAPARRKNGRRRRTRRLHSQAFRNQVLAEAEKLGAARTAEKHGITASLIYRWKKAKP